MVNISLSKAEVEKTIAILKKELRFWEEQSENPPTDGHWVFANFKAKSINRILNKLTEAVSQ